MHKNIKYVHDFVVLVMKSCVVRKKMIYFAPQN